MIYRELRSVLKWYHLGKTSIGTTLTMVLLWEMWSGTRLLHNTVMRLTNHSHRYKPPSQKSFTKLTMVATITMGWVPLVMVISISSTKELYHSTNRTTIVATIVLTIVSIEVALGLLLTVCLDSFRSTIFH